MIKGFLKFRLRYAWKDLHTWFLQGLIFTSESSHSSWDYFLCPLQKRQDLEDIFFFLLATWHPFPLSNIPRSQVSFEKLPSPLPCGQTLQNSKSRFLPLKWPHPPNHPHPPDPHAHPRKSETFPAQSSTHCHSHHPLESRSGHVT